VHPNRPLYLHSMSTAMSLFSGWALRAKRRRKKHGKAEKM
jgi:hypothetical protein